MKRYDPPPRESGTNVELASCVQSAPLSTRDRLKTAARQLFAERGIEGATVRDILVSSGEKNGASLNYYFGTKEDLIREITVDLFTMMDDRWARGLKQVQGLQKSDLRDYLRVLVDASDTSDVEVVPTAARMAQTLALNRRHLVSSVMKEYKLSSYDRVLTGLAAHLRGTPPAILRQRLIFLTSYLSSLFALCETARVSLPAQGRIAPEVTLDLGNILDTAVGLLAAPVVDGRGLKQAS